MNTKTMRLPPRRVLMPNKRKERDEFDLKPSLPPPKLAKIPAVAVAVAVTSTSTATSAVAAEADLERAAPPLPSNQLLAGYLAHEFLNKGTLFGQTFDATRTPTAGGVEERKGKASEAELREEEPEEERKRERYVEVASLLKREGAHLPGILNPTQLARFLRM